MDENSEEELIGKLKIIRRKDDEYVLLLDKVPDELLKKAIDICRGRKCISIRLKPSDIDRLDKLGIDICTGDIETYFYCETIAEASVKMLTNHKIKEILVGSKGNSCARKMDILKYSVIRYKLERIVTGLSGKSDKEKFKTIYTRLAHMLDYDKDAIVDGSEYAIQNEEASRNLENAVLLNTCVCQGFSEVLRQTLSLVGIESIICYSIEGEDGDKHTYNLVKLDGEWFNADLTWDYLDIRNRKSPKYCLKSDEDFIKCYNKDKPYHIPAEIGVPKCNTSVELFPEFRNQSRHRDRSRESRAITILQKIYNSFFNNKKVEDQKKLAAVDENNFRNKIKSDISENLDLKNNTYSHNNANFKSRDYRNENDILK